jgi:hypothetical protein
MPPTGSSTEARRTTGGALGVPRDRSAAVNSAGLRQKVVGELVTESNQNVRMAAQVAGRYGVNPVDRRCHSRPHRNGRYARTGARKLSIEGQHMVVR